MPRMTCSPRLSLGVLVGLFVGGCGPEPVPPAPEATGARGAALAGRVEVVVVVEPERRPVVDAVVRARAIEDGALLAEARTDAAGLAVLEAAGLRGAVTIEAAGPTGAQLWMGVRTDDVVIALPGERARATVAGNVRAIPAAWGGTEVQVGAATEISLLRTSALARASTAPCAPSGADGCTFSLERAEAPETLAVATVAGPSGAAAGFVMGTLGPAGGTLDRPVDATDLALTLPAATGLTGIIGVPGVARDGALVLLPQRALDPALLAVPGADALAPTDRYWVIVEARPMGAGGLGDPDARSVLFARGARSAADLPRWSSWLPAPSATLAVDGGVSFEAVPGADVHVVDWLDAAGAIVASAWVLDPTVLSVEALRPTALDPGGRVTRVRVRALDTVAPSASGFELTTLELGVERFSERDLVGL
jgi:hypothetical protein